MIRVKNKQLAKLREFREGMDLEKFMSTEFRQFIRALQNQFVENTLVYCDSQTTLSAGQIALNHGHSGVVKNNAFFPSEVGRYYVDFGFKTTINSGASTKTSTLTVSYTDGTEAGSAEQTTTQTVAMDIYPQNGIFMNLNKNLGVSFTLALSNATASKFHCKIFKVS